jgi:hypothetical protein
MRGAGLLAALFGVGIFAAGSTTGYVAAALGVGAVLAVALWVPEREMAALIRRRVGLGAAFGTLAAAALLLSAPRVLGISIVDYILQMHIGKLGGDFGSGATRSFAAAYTMDEVFARSPLLGVGYGSHRSLSFGTFLLANVGIVGAFAFAGFNGAAVFRGLRTATRASRGIDRQIALGAVVAFLATVPTMMIAKGAVTLLFGWYWFLIAVLDAQPDNARAS